MYFAPVCLRYVDFPLLFGPVITCKFMNGLWNGGCHTAQKYSQPRRYTRNALLVTNLLPAKDDALSIQIRESPRGCNGENIQTVGKGLRETESKMRHRVKYWRLHQSVVTGKRLKREDEPTNPNGLGAVVAPYITLLFFVRSVMYIFLQCPRGDGCLNRTLLGLNR